MRKLSEQAYAQVIEAEQWRGQVEDLANSVSAEIIARTYIVNWINAATEASRLCILACEILEHQEILDLKHRIEAKERGLWDTYVAAEWLSWPLWLIEMGLDTDEWEPPSLS